MRKKLVRIALGLFLLLLIVGGSAFWYLSRSGSGKLEQWIQSQLLTIANSYLNPKLSFTDLDYAYPLTVSIKNLKLSADDPANPGQAIDVIACAGASITLGEIPSIGKPIVIEKISLEKPLISAVATAAGSKEFVGFSNLIRPGAISPSPDAPPKPADAPSKLSDVFRMRLVKLIDGKIVYDPRLAGTVPMSLDQINTTLAIEPTSAGWYKLNVAIARKPVFDLAVAGQLDLDTFTVHDASIKLLADLSGDKLDFLPPELQQILKQYDAHGKLSVAITGTMPATDPMKGQLEANVTLSSAQVAMGDFKLPIENVDLNAKFAGGKADLTSMKIAALGGTADLSGSATLNDRLDADLSLKVSGMVLENLLKQGPGPNAAKLDLDFKVAGSLMAILGKSPGVVGQPLGAISLHDFRLSAQDPANAGQTLDIVAVKNLDISLAEPVISGKPIVIDKILLDHPVLSAVAVAPGSLQFVGVPNLPPSLTKPTKSPSAPDPKPPASVTASKISDLIRVKTFQLVGAKVIYDPRLPNTQRMWLDDINTNINLDPADPGVYMLDASIARKPVFDISADARINVDHPGVENLKLNLLADLTQGQVDFLVPQLQLLLKESHTTGKLTFSAAGSMPFGDLGKVKLHAESALENLTVVANGEKAPVEGFKFNADIADGKLTINTLSIAAVGSTFNLTGGAVLNDRMDSEITLHIAGLPIEKVLAAVKPGTKYDTYTLLDADVQVKAAIGVALSGVAAKPGEPAISLTVKNFHLTADDAGDNPLQFVSCDSLAVAVSSLPVGGKAIVIDSVVVDHPSIRAVAIEPGSNNLVGFANLKKIAAANAPATQPAGAARAPEIAPADPPMKLSSLFRLSKLAVNDASLYYDPGVANTVPMSIQHLSVNLTPDTTAGDVYTLAVATPAAPEFSLALGSKVHVDALAVTDLKLKLFADLAKSNSGFLPPQLQAPLKQYNVEGALNIEVTGGVPMTDPTAGNLLAILRLDNIKATAADYRIPIHHVHIPVQLKDKQIQILPASAAGGPMVELLDGTVDLTGNVQLDSTFTAPKLDLFVKDVQLQRLSEAKLHKDPKAQDLIGNTNAEVHLVNAPLRTLAAVAAPPDPKAPPAAPQVLPDDWGNGQVRITDARLAGLELIQGLGNMAKSAFTSVFQRDKAAGPAAIKPKEKANIDFKLSKNQIVFEKSKIYYEGEVVAVEGDGTVDLNGKLDLKLRGGPWGKLGNVGTFGKWVSDATSSLLNYTVTGSPTDASYPTISATTGDGKPVIETVTNLAGKGKEGVEKGVDATKQGLEKAGGIIGKLFKKKEE